MAIPIVTLKPANAADELVIDDAVYRFAEPPDWGDSSVEVSLATGPDVRGGVPGTRREATRQPVLSILVDESSGEDYLEAAQALDVAATTLARHGGTIAAQVVFDDGSLSEEAELEILSCQIAYSEEWQHLRLGTVTLTMEANPGWLVAEEQLATDATFTDSVKRLAYTARGNLDNPGRIVLVDNDSTTRRFSEIGGTGGQAPQEVEYLAADFTLVAATSDTDADAIGGAALEVTPVLPVWTTVGTLEALPHHGSYRVRVRTKGGEDESQFTTRVLWRAGPTDRWRDLIERVETPDATNFYDLDAGAIHHYGPSPEIEIRVDVRSTTASSQTYSFNGLTLMPSPLYVLATADEIELPDSAAAAFDDFVTLNTGNSLDDSDGFGTNRVAPKGGTWQEAGSGTAVEFSRGLTLGTITRQAASDSTSTLATGHLAYITDGTGATSYTDVRCELTGAVRYPNTSTKNTQAMLLAVIRYVDINNWLGAGVRIRRKNDGTRSFYFEVYKRDGGGALVSLGQKNLDSLIQSGATWGIEATAAGAWTATIQGAGKKNSGTLEGTDADLAGPSGSHKTGKVGMYSLVQSAARAAGTDVNQISAYGALQAREFTEVIRADGLGVLTHETAYASDADGTDVQEVHPQGNRIWIPPGAGEITAKIRSSNSETEPDEGAGLDSGIALYSRAAFANLSDAIE